MDSWTPLSKPHSAEYGWPESAEEYERCEQSGDDCQRYQHSNAGAKRFHFLEMTCDHLEVVKTCSDKCSGGKINPK